MNVTSRVALSLVCSAVIAGCSATPTHPDAGVVDARDGADRDDATAGDDAPREPPDASHLDAFGSDAPSRADGPLIDDAPPWDPDASTGALRVVWAKAYKLYAEPKALAPLADGGFVMGGGQPPLELPELPPSNRSVGPITLVTFDGAGVPTWATQFGSHLTEGLVTALATDGDDIRFGGYFRGDIYWWSGTLYRSQGHDLFIGRFDRRDPEGHVWFKHLYSAGRDDLHGLSLLPDEQIAVAGSHDSRGAGIRIGDVSLGSDTQCHSDRFVAKLSAEGDTLAATCFPEFDRAVVGSDGSLFVAERERLSRLDPNDGSRLWSFPIERFTWNATSPADQILATSLDAQGNFVATGRVGSVLGDGYELFAAKFRPSGEPIFLHRIAAGPDIAVDWVPKIQGRSLAVGPDGDVWIAGQFAGAVNLGGGKMIGAARPATKEAGFVVHYGPNGDFLQAFQLPAPVASIVRTSDGAVVIAGAFEGTIRIGDTTIPTPTPYNCMYAAKLAP